MNNEMFEARRLRIKLDSGEVVIEPFDDVAKHELNLGIVASRVPSFAQRVAPTFELVTIAGIVALVVHGKDGVGASGLRQGPQQ